MRRPLAGNSSPSQGGRPRSEGPGLIKAGRDNQRSYIKSRDADGVERGLDLAVGRLTEPHAPSRGGPRGHSQYLPAQMRAGENRRGPSSLPSLSGTRNEPRYEPLETRPRGNSHAHYRGCDSRHGTDSRTGPHPQEGMLGGRGWRPCLGAVACGLPVVATAPAPQQDAAADTGVQSTPILQNP